MNYNSQNRNGQTTVCRSRMAFRHSALSWREPCQNRAPCATSTAIKRRARHTTPALKVESFIEKHRLQPEPIREIVIDSERMQRFGEPCAPVGCKSRVFAVVAAELAKSKPITIADTVRNTGLMSFGCEKRAMRPSNINPKMKKPITPFERDGPFQYWLWGRINSRLAGLEASENLSTG